MNKNKNSLIAACCIFVALTASVVLAAPGLSPSFSYQGRFLNEAGTAPLSGTVDLKLGIYAPSGECLLYEESQTGIDLGASDGLFSVAVGSGLAPSSDATKRTLNDPGKAMAEVFSNASELRAPGSDDCDDGYTPQAGHGRKLRVTITPQGGGPASVLSPDLEINSVPQAQVADTLQGLDASRFVQITGNASSYVVSNSALDTLLGVGGVQDASSLHSHDSLYAKLSGSSSLALSSGSYLGLGVHAGNPDTTGWAADVTKTGRTWFDSGTNEIKYWDGSAVKSIGTSGAGVTSFNTRSGAVTLSSSDVTTALGFTPEVALTNPNDTTKYYRADKSWQTLNTTAVAEGTNLYFTEARVKGALSGGTGITYSPIDGSITVDAGTVANKIVQLDANAKLPAVDGSALTALNASNIASGTLSVDRIADGSIPATKLDSSVGSWSVDGSGNAYRASGNVGIGTASPSAKLEIIGDSDTSQLMIKANSSQANSNPLMKLLKSDGATELLRIHSDDPASLFIGANAGNVNNISGVSQEGLWNTFLGGNAGSSNTTGFKNVAINFDALSANTTGEQNIAIGYQALAINTTGHDNVGIGGHRPLYNNSTGSNNTSVGTYSMWGNTTGNSNSALGSFALSQNTTAENSTAIGANALRFGTTGASNTAMGSGAGVGNGSANQKTLTGSNNVFIGASASQDNAAQLTNASAIGYNAKSLVSNSVTLGNGATTLHLPYAYTDPSNFERFAINAAPGTITLSGESSGTGSSDIDLVLQPMGGGNVGIGTTTPATKLDVAGAVRIGDDATACAADLAGSIRYNSGALELCNGATWGGIATAVAYVSTDGSQTISGDKTFSGSNTHSGSSTFSGTATFSSAGPSPAVSIGGGGLTVTNGGINNSGGGISNSGNITAASTASNNLTIDSTSHATKGNIILAPNGGNVGVGTTSPSIKTHVRGTAAQPSSSGAIDSGLLLLDGSNGEGLAFGVSNVSPWNGWIQAQNYSDTAQSRPLALNPNGGNVGIGTASPSSKLHVNAAAGNPLTVQANSIDALIVDSTRHVGINKTPSFRLDIGEDTANSRGINVTNTAGVGTNYGFYSSANGSGTTNIAGYFSASGATNNYGLVVENGNVGIGTTSPSTTLNVVSPGSLTADFTTTATDSYIKIRDSSATTYIQASGSTGSLGTLTNSDIVFKPNSTEKVRITSSGNVGIGTTNPTAALHAVASGLPARLERSDTNASSVQQALVVTHSLSSGSVANGFGTGIQLNALYAGGGLTAGGMAAIVPDVTQTKADLYLGGTSGSGVEQSLYIQSGGNVGIGTANPQSRLHVSEASGGGGDVGIPLRLQRTTQSSANTYGVGLDFYGRSDGGVDLNFGRIASIRESGGGGNTDAGLAFFTMTDGALNAEALRISNSGNVGIGTASPGDKLEIGAGGNLSLVNGYSLHKTNSRTRYYNQANSNFSDIYNPNTDGGTSLAFRDGSGEVVRFTGGNVGIGTTNPSYPLVVKGAGSYIQQWQNAAGNEALRINADGSLGYNVTIQNLLTANALSVAGISGAGLFVNGSTLELRASTASPALSAAWNSDTILQPTRTGSSDGFGDVGINVNGTRAVTVRNTTGNVGIGTTNPGYKLDVQDGDINASGNVRAAGVALTSDARLKESVRPLENALENILNMRGVSFDWIDKTIDPDRQIGLIAQEVEQIYPEAVKTNKAGIKAVAYPALISPVIEAIKALFAKFQSDSAAKDRRLAALEAENAELKARTDALQSALCRIDSSAEICRDR